MTIVDEIIECFKESKENPTSRLSEITIMKFMLGERLAEKYSKTNLKNYKKYKKNWEAEDIRMFVYEADESWTLSDIEDTRLKNLIKAPLVHSVLIEKLTALAEKHFVSESSFTTSSFKKLCAYAFFNTAYPEKLFEPYRHGRLANYVVWEDAEKKISDTLIANGIVYIYGDAASGKTLLAKKILKDYFFKNTDIYFAKMDDPDLQKNLQELPFIDETHDVDTALSYLATKSEDSILIIKRPFITPEDYEFIEKHFSTLKMKFVILTQTDLTAKTPLCVSIKNRPDENLKNIYTKSRKCNDLTSDEFLTLLKIVSRNPYVLSLVAKTLHHFQNKEDYALLKEKFLDTTEWIWNLSEQPTLNESYHGKGKKSKQTLPRLISYILECYGCTNRYSSLSVWAKKPVAKNLLTNLSDFTKEEIDSALQRGLLEYADETHQIVVMPSLLADSIWEQHPEPYKEFQNKLQEFLKQLNSGMPIIIPYKTVYPIICTLVQRFHFQVYKISKTIVPHENAEFMEWNYLLIGLIHKLAELGNYEIAEEFVPYILLSKQKEYKKKWVIKDEALQSEQLIRKTLYFKAAFMKKGLSATTLSDLQNILTETSNLIVQNEKIDYDHATAIYFAVTSFESFIDYEIRLDKICLQNQTLTSDIFYSMYPQQIDDHLNILTNLLITLYSKTPNQKLEQDYLYYMLIKASRSNSNATFLTINGKISSYQDALNKLMTDSQELFFKASCQNLYYTLTRISNYKVYSLNFHENPLLKWAEAEVSYLASCLLGKYYSFDTIWSLGLCMCLFLPYRNQIKEKTRHHLYATWNSMLDLANEQITLSSKDREDLLRVISQYATQLS